MAYLEPFWWRIASLHSQLKNIILLDPVDFCFSKIFIKRSLWLINYLLPSTILTLILLILLHRKQTDGESQPLLSQQQDQQQQQLVPLQDTYMNSRAEALHNVESTIHELSNIFTQLATMVSQQGELAIRLVVELNI